MYTYILINVKNKKNVVSYTENDGEVRWWLIIIIIIEVIAQWNSHFVIFPWTVETDETNSALAGGFAKLAGRSGQIFFTGLDIFFLQIYLASHYRTYSFEILYNLPKNIWYFIYINIWNWCAHYQLNIFPRILLDVTVTRQHYNYLFLLSLVNIILYSDY